MRYLFVIGQVFVTAGTGSPPPALLAPNLPFTVWTQDASGTQVTDLVAKDGTTPLAVDGGGNPLADSTGLPPMFRGPDWTPAQVQILWIDNGSGQRFPVFPLEAVLLAITNAATGAGSLDVEGVQDTVAAMLLAGSGVSLSYDDTAGKLTIAATATISLANIPAGSMISVPYATAYAAANRAAALGSSRTDIVLRIWGGLDSDPAPSWFTTTNGDIWDLVPVGG
jgi:hypothetical protein